MVPVLGDVIEIWRLGWRCLPAPFRRGWSLNIQKASPGQLRPRLETIEAGDLQFPSARCPPSFLGRPRHEGSKTEGSVVIHCLSDPVHVVAHASIDSGAPRSGAGFCSPGHHTCQGPVANQGASRVTLCAGGKQKLLGRSIHDRPFPPSQGPLISNSPNTQESRSPVRPPSDPGVKARGFHVSPGSRILGPSTLFSQDLQSGLLGPSSFRSRNPGPHPILPQDPGAPAPSLL